MRWIASKFERYLDFGSAGLSTDDAIMLRRVRSFGVVAVGLGSVFSVIMPALNHSLHDALIGLGHGVAITLALCVIHKNGRVLHLGVHSMVGCILAFIYMHVLETGPFIDEAMVGGPSLVIGATTYVLGVRAAVGWTIVASVLTVATSFHLTPLEGESPERTAALLTLFSYRVIVLGAICGVAALGRRLSDDQARRLQYLASHDPLTGLLNRRAFEDRVVESVARSRRHNRYFGLIFLDLDRFKAVNDCFGHGVGDDALRMVADRIDGVTRESDAACRLGGDEFLVLVEDADEAKSVELTADRLVELLGRPLEIAGHALELSASAGVAIFPDDADDADSLLRMADKAMYDSKTSGGDRSGRALRPGLG